MKAIKSRTARRELMRLVLEMAAVTRKTVDAVEGRGDIAYESPEYDKLMDESVNIQCEMLSRVEWDIEIKAGKITKVLDLVPENQLRGYFIMEGEKANVCVSFTLTPENPGLIQEYTIRSIEKN